MKTTTEVEIKVGGRITSFTEIGEGTYRFVIETEMPVKEQEVKGDVFVLVEASKLSLDDEFMQHEPKTEREEKFKELLTKVIKKGVRDFYHPKYDPSFNEDGTSVTFKAGNKPAVGKSYDWWKSVAKKYCPERHSRLGTSLQYGAFLGILIKKLVEEGKSIKWAWNAVCNNSHELGHYWDSENANHTFEQTGSRGICGFYDLANVVKILADDDVDTDGLGLAGGCYSHDGILFPIADISHCTDCYSNRSNCVGWFVLS